MNDHGDGEYVEITSDLEVVFSPALIGHYFEDAEAVRFYYNGDQNFIGFKIIENEIDVRDYDLRIKDGRKNTRTEKSNVAYFLERVGIDVEEYGRYEVDDVEEDMLVIRLDR